MNQASHFLVSNSLSNQLQLVMLDVQVLAAESPSERRLSPCSFLFGSLCFPLQGLFPAIVQIVYSL